MLATTLLVSRLGGPAAQGSFALVKSLNDLLVAACSLGLPPAIVILLNRVSRGHRQLLRWIFIYGLILLFSLPVITAVLINLFDDKSIYSSIFVQSLLIGIASACLTVFAFLRGILLVYEDGPIFSIISIVQWMVIFISAALLLNRVNLVFEIAYTLAGILSLAAIIPLIRRRISKEDRSTILSTTDWTFLRNQSGHIMAQALLYGLQPFLSNAALSHIDPALKLVGLFNIAAMTVALPNLLVALVAPVLLNRWSKTLDWRGLQVVRKNALLFGFACQVMALASWPLVPPAVQLLFGSAFSEAVTPIRILLLATVCVIASRILTPAMQGLGRNDIVSWSCLARAITIAAVVATGYFSTDFPIIEIMAIGWAMGELAALAVLLIHSGSGDQDPGLRLSATKIEDITRELNEAP